jgi:hypothetical protein
MARRATWKRASDLIEFFRSAPSRLQKPDVLIVCGELESASRDGRASSVRRWEPGIGGSLDSPHVHVNLFLRTRRADVRVLSCRHVQAMKRHCGWLWKFLARCDSAAFGLGVERNSSDGTFGVAICAGASRTGAWREPIRPGGLDGSLPPVAAAAGEGPALRGT